MRKRLSFVELSFHCSLTAPSVVAIAARFVGAAGGAGGGVRTIATPAVPDSPLPLITETWAPKRGQECSVENLGQTADEQHQVVRDHFQHHVARPGRLAAAGDGGAEPALDHAHHG